MLKLNFGLHGKPITIRFIFNIFSFILLANYLGMRGFSPVLINFIIFDLYVHLVLWVIYNVNTYEFSSFILSSFPHTKFSYLILFSNSHFNRSRVAYYNTRANCIYCGLKKNCCLGDPSLIPIFIKDNCGTGFTDLFSHWDYFFDQRGVKYDMISCYIIRCSISRNWGLIRGYYVETRYEGLNFVVYYLNPYGTIFLSCMRDSYALKFLRVKEQEYLLYPFYVSTPVRGGQYLLFDGQLYRLLDNKEFIKYRNKLSKVNVGEDLIDVLSIIIVKGNLPSKNKSPGVLIKCSNCDNSFFLSKSICIRCRFSSYD